jgi:putative transposase
LTLTPLPLARLGLPDGRGRPDKVDVEKGCSLDNEACEGFFGRIKNEMFYGRSWAGVPIDRFADELDSYLRWCSEERIKMSLGAKSPKAYRQSIGWTA